MSIEHLYRGKRVDNGEWVYGDLIKDYLSGQYFIHPYGDSANESDKVGEEGCLMLFTFEVEPETISEYIGRTDDNGKKIFEGDILDDRDNNPHYVIVFDDGCFKVPSISEYKKEDFYTETADEFCFSVATVIGNIYDNPELLENKR